MEKSESATKLTKEEDEEEEEKRIREEYKRLLPTLTKFRNWMGSDIYLYQNFWILSFRLESTIAFQTHFKAQDTDLILATMPKSGTTWLKALVFATVNRARIPISGDEHHPLLTTNPHNLIPLLEGGLYNETLKPNLESIPSPRMFATHVPYTSLPSSITQHCKCKIVHICRNPLDQFISQFHYAFELRRPGDYQITLEEAFDNYCRGISAYGPFWDHFLGYWKASHDQQERVLFLKYEDMKDDIVSQLKMLARFLGCPFSAEEEEGGAIEQVVKLCSFDKLRDLEVNKNGEDNMGFKNSTYFRKGQVGDWANYVTPSMADRVKKVTDDKLQGSGLSFKFQ